MSLVARKTEYKGVVYRSKCEAMFAKWLELHLSGDWGWTPFETATDWLAPYENEVKSTRFDLLAARDAVEQSRLSQIARLKEWEAKRNGR